MTKFIIILEKIIMASFTSISSLKAVEIMLFKSRRFKTSFLFFYSKLIIFLLFIFILFWSGFFKENSTNYFELSLFRRSWNSTDFKLSFEWTIFPIRERILIISWHFDSFFSVLVNKFESIFSIERFSRFLF